MTSKVKTNDRCEHLRWPGEMGIEKTFIGSVNEGKGPSSQYCSWRCTWEHWETTMIISADGISGNGRVATEWQCGEAAMLIAAVRGQEQVATARKSMGKQWCWSLLRGRKWVMLVTALSTCPLLQVHMHLAHVLWLLVMPPWPYPQALATISTKLNFESNIWLVSVALFLLMYRPVCLHCNVKKH